MTDNNDKKVKLEDKSSFAKDLLSMGYIDSFVDYFYLASRKTPDIKSKYEREHQINIESVQVRTLSHNYEIKSLKAVQDLLKQAEEFLRYGSINQAIEKYTEIRHKIFYYGDILGSIYFNQKCINLAKRYNLIKQLIRALIAMGNCFDNTINVEDSILSMSFKEEAKKLFKHLNDKDFQLESAIYDSLIQLYKELANQQENQNNYEKSIEYLNKQLENLKNIIAIVPNMKAEKEKEKEYFEQQIEVYLKIANLNFKLKNYEDTLDCLSILKPLINNNSDTSNVILFLKYLVI